jgi:hypothetical protein
MYASDVIHRKRSQAVYRNLQLQKDWFNSGGTIRILGQKGGNDYAYMTDVQEGLIADTCWNVNIPISLTFTSGSVSSSLSGLTQVDFSNTTDGSLPNYIYDAGYGSGVVSISGIIDDATIRIPTQGMDFYFNGTNYGAANNIHWNTNNAIIFGNSFDSNIVSISANSSPAILLGNYDRLCSSLYYGTSFVTKNSSNFMITQIFVTFSNYYTDTTDLSKGQMRVRMIRELTGNNRQWVEVGILSAVPGPGYSNNPTVSYPSSPDSSGNIVDSNGDLIDSTKNSPWDITDGTRFLNVAGNEYSTAFPATGTTLLYQSDKLGNGWQFVKNAYVNTY